ncbi:MAG: hypothetical protein Q8M92_09870, partial [Candidatus Subteraquimicrobiales bacterium]|nr:hypothetical protein [Candidatus Subteraquimicrobiales bacterium]
IGYVLGGIVSRQLVKVFDWFELRVQKASMAQLLFEMVGLILGLVVATLIYFPFLKDLPYYLGQFLGVLVYLLSGYVGFRLVWRKQEEVSQVRTPLIREKAVSSLAVLDTSAIIDARIVEIVKTGFFTGQLLIPRFVLKELQNVADSEDKYRRNRGRQGLDALAALKKIPAVEIRIIEEEYQQLLDVDAKLVELAKVLSVPIVTTDFNLEKIAELQGVRVLNINDLAAALKPIVLPGEEITVRLIKEGKEADQGVGYLEDGTMIVVESGKKYVGEVVKIVIENALQTPAGRMIFGKIKKE